MSALETLALASPLRTKGDQNETSVHYEEWSLVAKVALFSKSRKITAF